MKILQLTKKDRELFLDMDPLFMMERLQFPGAFALAAVMEQEKPREDIPVGLAICIDTGKSILVQWLCAAKEYRRQGAGEHLLAAVYDVAVRAGYPVVYAYMNTEYGRELICAGEEKYLRDRLFTGDEPLAGEWVTDIRTLLGNPLVKKQTETGNMKVRPLQSLLSEEKRAALDCLAEKKNASALYPAEKNINYLDQDISCLLYEDGKLSGCLLIQSVERTDIQFQGNGVRNYTEKVLYPVFMCISESNGIRTLLAAVLEAAEKKYGSDCEVRILMNEGRYAPLMEYMLPDAKINNRFLTASVEDYKGQQETDPQILFLME